MKKINIKKITVISFSLLFLFLVGDVAYADDCTDLSPILESYYKASQSENIDDYMSLMDQDYLRENLLDNYEDYVKSAWETYDTKNYEINLYNCKLESEDALMYFNLKSTLVSEGEEVEMQRNYIVLFHKIDSWKIRYVMDEDVFSQFQTSLHSQLFLDATKDLIDKESDDVDKIIENASLVEEVLAGDFDDTISGGVASSLNRNESESSGSLKWVVIVLFFVVVGIGVLFFRKKKKE